MQDARSLDISLTKMEKITLATCTSVQEYLNQHEMCRLDIKDVGGEYTDSQMMSKLIRGLSNDYNPFVDQYHLLHDIDGLAPPDLKGLASRLLTFESKLRERHNNKTGTINHIRGEGHGWRERDKCTAEGCGKWGHKTERCWVLYPELKTSKAKRGNSADSAQKDTTKPKKITAMATADRGAIEKLLDDNACSQQKINQHTDNASQTEFKLSASSNVRMLIEDELIDDTDSWILDSGSNVHLVNDIKWFTKFKPISYSVGTADSSGELKIKGGGTVSLMIVQEDPHNDPIELILSTVAYAPGLRCNVMSMSMLTEVAGLQGIWNDKGIAICTPENNRIATATLQDGLYRMKLSTLADLQIKDADHTPPTKVVAAIINFSDPVWVWHRRLGHLSFEGLRKLLKMSNGIPLTDKQIKAKLGAICPVCATTKSVVKIPRDPASRRFEEAGRLIHVDVWGPYAIAGWEQTKYFLIFVDDATRFVWYKRLSARAEIPEIFRALHKTIEREHNITIRSYRSDNEFNTKVISHWATKYGINWEFAAPYQHHQNGVVERTHRVHRDTSAALIREQSISGQIVRIIRERGTELLRNTSIPESLWPEAFAQAIWLRNRSPTKALQFKKTPWEAFHNNQPNLEKERIWGSRTYITRPHETRARDYKLNTPRGWLGYFVGCESESIYRIWDPAKSKVVRISSARIEDGEGHDDEHEQPSMNHRVPPPQQVSQPDEAETSAGGEESNEEDVEINTDDQRETSGQIHKGQVNMLKGHRTYEEDDDRETALSQTNYSDFTGYKKTKTDQDLEEDDDQVLDMDEDEDMLDLEDDQDQESAQYLNHTRCDRCMRNGNTCKGGMPCQTCKERGYTCKEPTTLTIDWVKKEFPNRLIPKQDPSERCSFCYTSKQKCDMVEPHCNHCVQAKAKCELAGTICQQCIKHGRICKPQAPIQRRGARQERYLKCGSCLKYQTKCDGAKPKCGACVMFHRQCKPQTAYQLKASHHFEDQRIIKKQNPKCHYCTIKRLKCDGAEPYTGAAACTKCKDRRIACVPYHPREKREAGVPKDEKCIQCLKNGYLCDGKRPCGKCVKNRSKCFPQDYQKSKGDEKCRYCLQHKRICVGGRPCEVCVKGDYPCTFFEADGHTKRTYVRRSQLETFEPHEDCQYCQSKKFVEKCDGKSPCQHCSARSAICSCTYKKPGGTIQSYCTGKDFNRGRQTEKHWEMRKEQRKGTAVSEESASLVLSSDEENLAAEGEIDNDEADDDQPAKERRSKRLKNANKTDLQKDLQSDDTANDTSVSEYNDPDHDDSTDDHETNGIAENSDDILDDYNENIESTNDETDESVSSDHQEDLLLDSEPKHSRAPSREVEGELDEDLFLGEEKASDEQQPVDEDLFLEGAASDVSKAHKRSGDSDTDDDRSIQTLRYLDKGGKRRRLAYLLRSLPQTKSDKNNEEPTSRKQALKTSEASQWIEAMQEEYNSLTKNKTWSIVNYNKDQHVLSGKWVFKRKIGPDGKIARYKARFVVRGFEQIHGIDFDETYASVVKAQTYKLIFALQAHYGWHCRQSDVKTAFLYGDVEEDIYLEAPEGYEVQPGKVLKLLKALYGLKQAPRQWYRRLQDYLIQNGWIRSDWDHSLFIQPKLKLFMTVYVDDINIFGQSEEMIKRAQESLATEFEMKDLGPVSYYLGMNVSYGKEGTVHLCQETFIHQLIQRYDLDSLRPSKIPMEPSVKLSSKVGQKLNMDQKKQYQSMVGALNYLATVSRLDISLATGVAARFCADPTQEHMDAVYKIYAYLKGTPSIGPVYKKNGWCFEGFVDSDWAGCPDTRRSTSGFLYTLSGGPFSWCSKRQKSVALSTYEAEYVAAAETAKEAIWLKSLINKLSTGQEISDVQLYIDNNAAMKLAKNPEFHGRTKHIELRHHFLRERVLDGELTLTRVDTKNNLADILTKPLPRVTFEYLREKMGLATKSEIES